MIKSNESIKQINDEMKTCEQSIHTKDLFASAQFENRPALPETLYKPTYRVCEQIRLRQNCADAQSHPNHHYSLMNVAALLNLYMRHKIL